MNNISTSHSGAGIGNVKSDLHRCCWRQSGLTRKTQYRVRVDKVYVHARTLARGAYIANIVDAGRGYMSTIKFWPQKLQSQVRDKILSGIMSGFLRDALLPVIFFGLLAYLHGGVQASLFDGYAGVEAESNHSWSNYTENATYKGVPEVR